MPNSWTDFLKIVWRVRKHDKTSQNTPWRLLTSRQKWQKFSNLGQWPPQASTATSHDGSNNGTAGCWWCRKTRPPPPVEAAVGSPGVADGCLATAAPEFCGGNGGRYNCDWTDVAGGCCCCWWCRTGADGGSEGQPAADVMSGRWCCCCCWWWYSWCWDWWCVVLYLTPAVVTDDKASGSVVAPPPPPPLWCRARDDCRWLLYTRWCLDRRLAVYARSFELFDDDPPAAGECLSALHAFLLDHNLCVIITL